MSHPDDNDADKINGKPLGHEAKRQRISGILLIASFLLIAILMVVIEKVLY